MTTILCDDHRAVLSSDLPREKGSGDMYSRSNALMAFVLWLHPPRKESGVAVALGGSSLCLSLSLSLFLSLSLSLSRSLYKP